MTKNSILHHYHNIYQQHWNNTIHMDMIRSMSQMYLDNILVLLLDLHKFDENLLNNLLVAVMEVAAVVVALVVRAVVVVGVVL